MPDLQRVANSVLTKTQRQFARERAFRMLQRGETPEHTVETIRREYRAGTKEAKRLVSYVTHSINNLIRR